jgi:hypothetical protein
MARHNRLRTKEDERPAKAGLLVVLQSISPMHLAAILAIAAASFLAVWQLADFGGSSPTAQGSLTRALGEPQSRASLVRTPLLIRTRRLDSRNLDPNSSVESAIAFTAPSGQTSDLRLLPVVLLTFAGSNIAPAGLGSKLKRGSGGGGWKLELNSYAPTFSVSYAIDPVTDASAATASNTVVSRKVLDLSRPTRAGPGGIQAINTRPAAPSDPASGFRRHLGGE